MKLPNSLHRLQITAIASILAVLLVLGSCVSNKNSRIKQPAENQPSDPQYTAEQQKIIEQYHKTEIKLAGASKDLARTYRAFGNPEAEKVVIYNQGGPVPILEIDDMAFLAHDFGVDMQDVLIIHMLQQNMLQAEQLANQSISFEQAKQIGQNSLQMLHNVVIFLQSKNRQVSLWGSSYGAFLTAGYLATYDNNLHTIVMAVGRLDMPAEVWQPFSEGSYVHFAEDGQTIILEPEEELEETDATPYLHSNLAKIAAGFGYRRFTKELAGKQLSNVLYIYSLVDQSVGKLTEAELAFLKDHNVEVIPSNKSHSEAELEHAEQLINFLLGN